MNKWTLPAALHIGAADFAIRADFRVILGIFRVLNSEDYTEAEKWEIALRSFYVDAETLPDVEQAIQQMQIFFSGGMDSTEDDKKRPQLMDWEQDTDMLIPAVNKSAGYDVRGVPFLHWWTFLSYYMEIGESTFSTVVSIRRKMAYGEKLEQYEKDFVRDQPNTVILRDAKRRAEDAEDRAALAALGL